MAKRQSFADKAAKKKHVVDCKVCSSPIIPTLVVLPQTAGKGNIKYKKSMVNICKCNHKEIYG